MNRIDDLFERLFELEKELGKGKTQTNPYIAQYSDKSIIIYGAGALGHEVFDGVCKYGIKPHFFCSGLIGGYVDKTTGLRVLCKEDLASHTDSIIVFAIGDTATEEEKNQLKIDVWNMGFQKWQIIDHSLLEEKISPSYLIEHKEEIYETYHLLSDEKSKKVFLKKLEYMVQYIQIDFEADHKMYVDSEIVSLDTDEVIIDAGAYDGDTARMFRQKTGEKASIYSFEPDRCNYKKLTDSVREDKKIYTENMGLWNERKTLLFTDSKNGSSHIQDNGTVKIEVTDLDSYCDDKGIIPTYIKMDIEGAEFEALNGAKSIISKYAPVLAVCLYHKPEDIFEIPRLAHDICSEYMLYIRHYSGYRTDTLLYAIKNKSR